MIKSPSIGILLIDGPFVLRWKRYKRYIKVGKDILPDNLSGIKNNFCANWSEVEIVSYRLWLRAKLGVLTKWYISSFGQRKKTPCGVNLCILSSFSDSWPQQTRDSGPPLPRYLVVRRVLSYARAFVRQTCPHTRSAAASAPPGTPDCNGAPDCAVCLL